ncbi:MAG: OmpH family outer membrane protein [Bacteroidales bacterium]|nr:OmpH family outer membrane protein [Bacteroidales bacterium]
MKKTFTLFAAAITGALFISSCSLFESKDAQKETTEKVSAASGSIVYINLDRILREYDMANDLTSVVNAKAQGIEEDINRRGGKLERDQKDFENKINKGLMTQSTAEVQYKKLQDDQLNLQNYAARKQQEIQEEFAVTQNQILDAIGSFLKEYNAEKGYAMILTTQGDNLSLPIACADTTLDITNEVVEGLNKAYVKEKNSK